MQLACTVNSPMGKGAAFVFLSGYKGHSIEREVPSLSEEAEALTWAPLSTQSQLPWR